MGNNQEEPFWQEYKAFKKKKARFLFKTSEHEPEQPKKRRNPLVLWGGALFFLIVIFGIASLIASKPNPVLAEIEELSGKGIKHENIHEYLLKTQTLAEEISQHINKVSGDLSVQELTVLKKELLEFKETAKTEVVYLVPLKHYYQNQIRLEEKIIEKMIQDKKGEGFFPTFQIRELKKDFNKNIPMEQEVIIALFEKAGITYKVQQDSSLYYELDVSESK